MSQFQRQRYQEMTQLAPSLDCLIKCFFCERFSNVFTIVYEKAYKARCHTIHLPRDVVITVRMCTTISPGRVSCNHGQLFQPCWPL